MLLGYGFVTHNGVGTLISFLNETFKCHSVNMEVICNTSQTFPCCNLLCCTCQYIWGAPPGGFTLVITHFPEIKVNKELKLNFSEERIFTSKLHEENNRTVRVALIKAPET